MNLADVNGEHISRAEFRRDKAFESFVRELLEHERVSRHHLSVKIDGPVERYHGDDQRDLVFRVVRPPRTSLEDGYSAALTWDELGETWYSCKGGDGWRESLEKELGRGAFSRSQKDGVEPGPKVKLKPSDALLHHLSEGGRYVFVISQQTMGERPWLTKISELLGFWLRHQELPVPSALRDQLALFDGNHLADFIRANKPTLSAEVVNALGAQEPAAVMSFEAWRRRVTPGREPPDFEPDASRKQILDALRSDEPRIVRVHGAPGVGKTRLIYEALSSQPERVPRVRYSDEPSRLLDELRGWLPRSRQLTLVVDEVRSLDVDEFVRRFLADASEDSRMILIGTSDGATQRDHGGRVETHRLEVLSKATTRALIDREFERASEGPNTHTEAILRLSEGYPLFALKLAEALARDGDALALGTDESNRWRAAARVLVGPRTGIEDWDGEVERRGRCLLVVLLTQERPMEWEQLWEHHGDALARAVDHDVAELRRARAACAKRELLREVGAHHRYVSPANLARILLNHYIGGDPDLGPRIVRHTPEFAAGLLRLAVRVQAQPEVSHRLARAQWVELRSLTARRDMSELGRWIGRASGPAHEVDPHGAARAYAELVRAHADELTAADRRDVTQVLTHVTRRHIDADTFARAEYAMFRLAQLDANREIHEPWEALFLVALSPTHQPWPLRLGLLRDHARSSDIDERRTVATAMMSLLGDQRTGPSYFEPDQLDGDWPTLTVGEVWEGHRELWALGVELSVDTDAEVARLARVAVAERFSEGGLRPETVEALTSAVGDWLPQQRQPLREATNDVLHFRAVELEEHPEFVASLGRLLAALEPVDLLSRIVARMSSQNPEPWWSAADIDTVIELTSVRDREVAEELRLAPGDTVDSILSWMSSPEATRAWPFALALGEVDIERRLLPRLERYTYESGGMDPLAAYIAGWLREDSSAADAWLREHLDSPLSSSVVGALAASAPSPQRFKLLEAVVEGQRASAADMRRFVERRWIHVIEPLRALDLLDTMLTLQIAPTSALEMGLQLLDHPLTAELRLRALKALAAALLASTERRIPMVAQLAWQRAASTLLEAGHSEVVAQRLLRLLDHGRGNLALAERALAQLLTDGHGPALWQHMRDDLSDPSKLGRASHLARVGMLRRLDGDELLIWVGADQARARLVARLTTPYGEQLDPMVEALLRCFGGTGEIARELRGRALSSPLAAPALEFERRQRDHAQAWVEQTNIVEVRSWAEELVATLEEEIRTQEFRASLRKRYA